MRFDIDLKVRYAQRSDITILCFPQQIRDRKSDDLTAALPLRDLEVRVATYWMYGLCQVRDGGEWRPVGLHSGKTCRQRLDDREIM